MASTTVKLKDIRSATEASIKAVLGKRYVSKPGVLVGLWIDKATIGKLGTGASQLAKDVAKQVSVTSGIRVVPGIRPLRGGVLVGYIQPKIFK